MLRFNFSIQLNTFSKKFQFNSTLFKSSIQLELEYSTWRDQFNYKWSKNLWLINCIDIETSSSHQQCCRVIDEKISDKIVISSDESESHDYSARRSSNLLIMLIYWESLNSSSLLDVKSYIYLHEKSRTHENDQNTFSTIDQSHALNDCDCTFILTIYSTSTWHKSNQEQNRII